MEQALTVEQVVPDAAARLLEEGAVLIDVREPEEWLVGRAPQAVHIPLGELGSRVSELPSDRKLIMVCRSGGRSGRAALALVQYGLTAVNLAGGMQAWKSASFPVVADGGVPGEVA
ncbi:MAG: rhodanese-like domain-containing protein [Acidimicrobiales bacterium]|jgi:rhodanese-related sulfurtransferase